MRRGSESGCVVLALLLGLSPGSPGDEPSRWLPPLPRDVTRVVGTLRPFLVVPGPGFGMISDLAIEHYFALPLKLAFSLEPMALATEPDGTGFIGHIRGGLAYAGDFIEVGLLAGGQVQHFGASGVALAATLRLGALDGLNLIFENGYSLIHGYYTGREAFALDHFLGSVNVPVARRLSLSVEGGYGVNLWAYAVLGLRHRLRGQGGRGTVVLSGGLGAVLVVDRFPCQYQDPAPCEGAMPGFGPTVTAGADGRF